MKKRISVRVLSLLMAVAMFACVLQMTPVVKGGVTNYEDFMKNLKVLEGYAEEYAKQIYGKEAGELVLNFIRTGVERYQDSNWTTLAGVEEAGFTSYVEAQDGEKGTTAMLLKDIIIDDFTLPNGNQVDFGHMFGCMNISYVAKGSADLSGWAGDICDLLQYSVKNIDDINSNTDGSIESMAAYIGENCFRVGASGAFGEDDFWGDMDAYYLVSEYNKANGSKKFSEIMEAYFTADLNDTDRTVYFMNNRFAVADNAEAVRKAIYESYSADVGIKILESKRGLTSYVKLREACCYAVADYIYSKAQGQLIEGSGNEDVASNGYYSVFSNEHSILAPGIEQDINYAQTVDGKQIVYYVATVDVKRDDVDIMVNYKDNKPPVAGSHIGLQRVEDQVAALVKNNADKENFYPIVATNGAGYNISNGTPAGLVVMQGIEYYPVGAPGFFAILKDGTAMIGTKEDYNAHKAEIQEGIAAFGAVLVKDGKINVTKNANYTASRASRTAIGIKKDGSVVMMVLDGRQLPFSAGGAMEEIAQIMLEAGCVQAVNLDGGGSTTYLSKPAGSDQIQLVNRPSDGIARSVATSLVAVSTAKSSNEFDHAIVSSDYDYITAGTSMQMNVTGVSNTGNNAIIPEGSYWRVSDDTIGTIDENGVFTAAANGDVTVEYIVNDKVEGSKTLHVVIPDDIKFVENNITAVYGVPKKIDVTVWYKGNPVAFTPMMEVILCFQEVNDDGETIYVMESSAGIIEGLTFTGDATSNVRTKPIVAMLATANGDILMKMATINLYYADETTFDFENATQGNRTLAWNRVVSNTHTFDDQLYLISDPNVPVEMEYTFALDMTAIEMPAQLEPIQGMLPTYQEGASAWTYLLQLAERVCNQTTVTITVDFSTDVMVDISNLKITNDYFTLSKAELDANNRLTVVCNWVDRTEPIDAATANSLCLLTGVKTILKDTAAFYNNEIVISNNGTVAYDIYLAASSLHSFVTDPANNAQVLYGLYPYTHSDEAYPNGCRTDGNDSGAHFSNQYADFADTYVLSSETRNGWHEDYYYVNNVPVTGIQLVPDRHDATKDRFCEFDENGKLVSEQGVTGLVTFEENLYYAVLGVAQTGWQQINDDNYYFDPDTGKAVDGEVQIKEQVHPGHDWSGSKFYTYTFTDHILTRGEMCYDKDGTAYGYRYRWAGTWLTSTWFEFDGNTYHATSYYPYFITTGYAHYISTYKEEPATYCYLFDETGALMKDYIGAKYVTWTSVDENKVTIQHSDTRMFKNGELYGSPGIIKGSEGYYFYVKDGWTGSVYTNADVAVPANRYGIPAGTYHFDEQGRLTEKLVSVDEKLPEGTTVSVLGAGVTVSNAKPCKAYYKDGNNYVALDAIANEDGTYNFAVPTIGKTVSIVLAGDVDLDGDVDSDDLTKLSDIVISETAPAGIYTVTADINGNGVINSADRALLARALLEDGELQKDLEW